MWGQASSSWKVLAGAVALANNVAKGAALVGYRNRTVHARLDDYYNVKDYGAVGDGTTNDAAAIQALIDTVNAAGGGTIYFPAGVYNIGATALNVKTKVTLCGAGPINFGNDAATADQGATVIKYSGAAYAINLGDTTYNCYSGGLEKLSISGGGTAANGVRIEGTSGGASVGCHLHNVNAVNFTGVGFHFGNYAYVCDLHRINARSCTTAGFRLDQSSNRYNLSQMDATYCGIGFLFGGGAGATSEGIIVFGGRAEHCPYGVDIQAPARTVSLFGVYIEAFTTRGIRCQGTTQNVTIIGCPINGASALGSHIAVYGGGHVNIQGNTFTGAVKDDIDLGSNAVFGVIKGNKHLSTVTGSRVTAPPAGSCIELQTDYSGTTAVHRTHDYIDGSFTPAWTNLTVGDASINTAKYTKIGKQVTVKTKLKWGSTTSASGAFYINNLPYTVDTDVAAFGAGNLLDSGTANIPCHSKAVNNTTNLYPLALNAAGTYLTQSAVNATVPFTFAVNDEIELTITYMTS